MEQAIRNEVRKRAVNRCEYCRLRQQDEEENPFHVEHVIAQQHGGTHDLNNLALACSWCNAIKGPNLWSFKHFCVMRSDEKSAKEQGWTRKHGKNCWV